MAAKWLSSTRLRKKEDIRDFIAVHGKVLKTSLVERTNVPSHVSMRQTTMAQQGEDCRSGSSTGSRAPASRFSTGVRRKVAATVVLPEQESEMKENIDTKISISPVLSTQYSFDLDDDGQSNCFGRLLASGRPLPSSSRQVSHSKKAVTTPAHAPTQKARKRLRRLNTNRHQSSSGRQVKVLLSNHCHGPAHSDHNPQPHSPAHKLPKGDTPTLQDSGSPLDGCIAVTRSKQSQIDHVMSTDELKATEHAGRLPHHTSSGDLFTESGGIRAGKDTMENSSGNVSWIDAELPTLSSAHSSSGMNCDTNELLAELSGLEKFV